MVVTRAFENGGNGIKAIEHLLAQAATPSWRAALATDLDVSSSQLTDWINCADLMGLNGVGAGWRICWR
jgi:hypothetical protein